MSTGYLQENAKCHLLPSAVQFIVSHCSRICCIKPTAVFNVLLHVLHSSDTLCRLGWSFLDASWLQNKGRWADRIMQVPLHTVSAYAHSHTSFLNL